MKITKTEKTVTTESIKLNGQEYQSFDELPDHIKKELDKDGNGQMDFLEGKDNRVQVKTIKRKVHPAKFSMHFEKNYKTPAPSEAEKQFSGELIRGIFIIIGIGIAITALRFTLF